jgi:chromosome partitioning protein
MKIITVASTKGGPGKTTVAQSIATGFDATKANKVLLLDADPQGTCIDWIQLREAETPLVVAVGSENLASVVQEAREEGFTHVVIDTSPSQSLLMADTMKMADLVVFVANPRVRVLMALPNFRDEFITSKAKGVAVLNFAHPGQASTEAAVEYLRENFPEINVCPTVIRHYKIHDDLAAAGMTANELTPTPSQTSENNAKTDILGVLKFIKRELS